ncbi:MAG: iron-containing alcohol dehydrogenase, partial [Burkholderiaceae bacterium]|nr:iron-containing alcohol dehydrogenase [Burkholderiaceae bacterium]
NQEAVPAKFAELAHAVGAGGGEAFVPWLAKLKHDLGISPNLTAVGVKREQIDRLVEVAEKDICHQTNPRPCRSEDFARFFEQAL